MYSFNSSAVVSVLRFSFKIASDTFGVGTRIALPVSLPASSSLSKGKNDALAEKWTKLRAIRRVVLGALEPKRADKTIGSSLEANPHIYLASDLASAVEGVDLAELCITSQVQLHVGTEAPTDAFKLNDVAGVGVSFAKAEGQKCQRCWKILPDVGTDKDYPDLSARDADAVRWYVEQKQKAA